MSLEIKVSAQFQLHTEVTNNLNLLLPVIAIGPSGNNIPHLSRITCTVTGTPPEIAKQIETVYQELIFDTPFKLSNLNKLPKKPCILDKPLAEAVDCILRVAIDYYDSDIEGNPLKSQRKHVDASSKLWFRGVAQETTVLEQPETTPPPDTNISDSTQTNSDEIKRFPGWFAIDFGTSNSTVTLYDPREVPKTDILPQEQEQRLRERLSEWLGSLSAIALPNVNIQEWGRFINEISSNLEVEASELPSIIKTGKHQQFLEALRQIELCLGMSEKFRRAVSKKLYEIYHEVFRIPTLDSQSLIPVILDSTRRATEISSELEITGLNPVKVVMGEEAKENRNKANAQASNNSSQDISKRFHHSPKRYFGQNKEFTVTLNDDTKKIAIGDMMQAAWGHLKELTEKDLKSERRKFSQGEFRTAVITYPTVASPSTRQQIQELVGKLDIDDIQIAYDEAVSVAIFFLWREFGGNLPLGIESFKTRCRRNGNEKKWSQNLLILDIGGGTTDIALIKLTLEDKTPIFENKEHLALGGRYYKLTPKLLGSSGHLQLGGEYITLKIFGLLKVAIADHLLTELATGNIENEQLEEVINTLDERFLEDGQFKPGSLLECLDEETPERANAAYKDALNTAEKVLPTRWKKDSKRLQSFYLLWKHAEAAKIQLGKEPPTEDFILHEPEIIDLLSASDIKLENKNSSDLSVKLDSNQFERAAKNPVEEAIGIAQDLMKSRLDTEENRDENNSPIEKVDWLILSGKTCSMDIVKREIYQKLNSLDYFVWNPERITFDPEFTKIATSAGACYAEKLRRFRFDPKESKEILAQGGYQLEIDVKNLSYYLPCNIIRKTSDKEKLTIFKAGEQLYQISPNDKEAKLRSDWKGIQLTNIIYRQDFDDGELRIWGSYDGKNKLLEELSLSEVEFLDEIKVQFEIDQNLDGLKLLFVRKKPHRLIPSNTENIDVTQAISEIPGQAQKPALFTNGKLAWNIAVGDDDKELKNGDIAINVIESATVDLSNGHKLVFKANLSNNLSQNNQSLEVFHYEGNDVSQQVNGLISEPLPAFPQSNKHTFYVYHQDDKKWIRIGELNKPKVTTDYPCRYYVTLDEKGILRIHAGEVLYWTSDNKQCLNQEGWVYQDKLQLQDSDINQQRDPFSGIH